MHLPLEVQLVRVVAHLAQEVVPSHIFHCLYGKHFSGMGNQPQLLEYLFETERLVGIAHEQILQHLGNFLLRQSFTVFLLLCHIVVF